MDRRLLVYGAGGHGRVVADIGRALGLDLVGFLDDDDARDRGLVAGAPVISWARFARERESFGDVAIALGIGDNAARARSMERVLALGVPVATLAHTRAVVAPSARLGAGTVVMAAAVVNPDADVGRGVIVNTGAIVEHDVVLGDFVHISPNAALGGAVRVGAQAHVGLGAAVIPCIHIGERARVGAGAAVVRDVPPDITVAGVPARPLRPSTKKDPA
ncbi:MAG: acetyltransferase [Polyangiaceae bacterium]|nr:acetyltransferase [Polyangiaceae bacterium]